MNRRKRRIGIVLLVLLALIVPPVWITYREYRQVRLDHALIAAIKAGDDKKALEALAEGASGEARDIGIPPTFRQTLRQLWDRVRRPEQVKDSPDKHCPALLLLCRHEYQKEALISWKGPGPNVSLVRSLLEHGAGINDRYGDDGRTPLWFASNFSNCETTRLLLEHGADPNLVNTGLMTPLMLAQDAKTAELLLKYGANSEAVDMQKIKALMWAAYWGRVDVVRILLEHGAKVEAKGPNGWIALYFAQNFVERYPHNPDGPKIIALLKQYGAK